MTEYNKTQLNPEKTVMERHIFHRDQFAHILRWYHVMKVMRPGMRIIDIGCGSGNLAKTLYHNRMIPEEYIGIDIRKQTISKLGIDAASLLWAHFYAADLAKPLDLSNYPQPWHIITCFEVVEHVGKDNVPQLLDNMRALADQDTLVLLSTPNYDAKVGAADNHIIDGHVMEWGHEELQAMLEKYFVIIKKFGTFASQKDYEPLLNDWQQKMYDQLKQYYDTTMLSIIMAPFFPEKARNCLWVLKKRL